MGEQLEIVYRDPATLEPDESNPNTHPDEQILTLRRLMDEFGNYAPILLRDDERTIGAGHGRRLAALLPPAMTLAPTITLRGLSDDQWRALVIADNRIAAGSRFDEDLLRANLSQLLSVDFDLTLTAFTQLEIGDLFAPPKPHWVPDRTPLPPAVPVSRGGDLWRLGDHRILCGDSTSREDVARLMEVDADLCLTDPPYGIGYAYEGHDDSDNAANAQLVERAFALAPKAKVWTPGLMNLTRDIGRFGAAKVLCWQKGWAHSHNGLGGASTWEPVLVVGPKRKKLPDDHFEFKMDHEQLDGKPLRKHHPCPKPVALFQHLATAFCPADGTVYDPFLGSGTTLIAAELSQRHCRGMELTPAYVDVSIMRWEGLTGQQATLEETGETYQQVKDRRLDPI